MAYNKLKLNPQKCVIVGRGPQGDSVTAAQLEAHRINIEGHSIVPLSHAQSIRYLGAHSCFDGSCSTQQQKSREMIMIYTRLIIKFKLCIRQAVYVFNIFLLPKLEIALHYTHGIGTAKWIKDCDRLLVGVIKHIATSPIRLSHSAVALCTGLKLPSWLETSVKVSELFLRMNSSDGRWGHLGRILMQSQLPSYMDRDTVACQPHRGSRITRACYLATHYLNWHIHFAGTRRRHQHMLKADTLDSGPHPHQCSSTSSITINGTTHHIAHDCWTGWGASLPAPMSTVHMYTDGSFSDFSSRSAWSVVIADDWFHHNHAAIPADEHLLQPFHLAGSVSLGACSPNTQGVYPAELQAIARALAMVPVTMSLHIHSDSQASLAAIHSYSNQKRERKQMRMQSRPLLSLISSMLLRRQQHGSTTQLSHIEAHTTNTDRHSIGNRMADYQANRARLTPDRSYPRGLSLLPLAHLEPHMSINRPTTNVLDGALVHTSTPIIDDIRHTALSDSHQLAMSKWQQSPQQGLLASAGVRDLSLAVMQTGGHQLQSSLLHLVTNTIHFHWGHHNTLHQVFCHTCSAAMTLDHLVECRQVAVCNFRYHLKQQLIALIRTVDGSASWLRHHSHVSLVPFLSTLFPSPDGHAWDLLNITRCMIGAFTSVQRRSAIRLLQLRDHKSGLAMFQQFRLVCAEEVSTLFSQWKDSG